MFRAQNIKQVQPNEVWVFVTYIIQCEWVNPLTAVSKTGKWPVMDGCWHVLVVSHLHLTHSLIQAREAPTSSIS